MLSSYVTFGFPNFDSPFIRISKLWTILKWRYDRVNLKCCYFFCSRSEGNQLKRNLKPRFERVKAFKHHCGVIFLFRWFNANKVLMFLFLYHLQKASFWTSNILLALNAIQFDSIWKIKFMHRKVPTISRKKVTVNMILLKRLWHERYCSFIIVYQNLRLQSAIQFMKNVVRISFGTHSFKLSLKWIFNSFKHVSLKKHFVGKTRRWRILNHKILFYRIKLHHWIINGYDQQLCRTYSVIWFL